MQKRTSYEFEGKVGYTYVTKAYGNTDVRFEAHFRASDNYVDVIEKDDYTTVIYKSLSSVY